MNRPSIVIRTDGVDEDDIPRLLAEIAVQAERGRESGSVETGTSQPLDWRIRHAGEPVPIDRRQRLAAAALLMGFDLPQEMGAASHSMLEAAAACPGLNTGDIPTMGRGGRRHALEHARRLIDEMLGEEVR